MTISIEGAARKLFSDHEDRKLYNNVARDFGVKDLDGAYAIQDAFVGLLAEREGDACGYKIALTTKTMQEMCGIDHPLSGVVFSRRALASGCQVALSDHVHVGIECEICVRLGDDLGGPGTTVSLEDAGAAADGVCAAFELIEDRLADYSDLDVNSLVADNAWNAGVVLGTFSGVPDDLASVKGTLDIDGERVDEGYGRAALGHPFEAVRWLANHLGKSGRHLRKGELVMTGSLVRTRFPEAGQKFHFDVTGVGSVDVSFGD